MSQQSNTTEESGADHESVSASTGDYQWTADRKTPSGLRLDPIVDRALTKAPKGGRVLDIGCGRGDQAGRVLSQGFQVTGVDVSSSGIELARKTYPDARFEVEAADENLLDRLNEDPFDVVISTEVCEHVYDPAAWARGCYSALRPGGLLIVSTPYHGYLKNLMISLKGGWDLHWSPLWLGGHIKFFSTKTLATLVEQTGFDSLEFKYAGRFAPLWMTMVCIARRPMDS